MRLVRGHQSFGHVMSLHDDLAQPMERVAPDDAEAVRRRHQTSVAGRGEVVTERR